MTYELLEAQFTAWAATQPDIRAVIAIGSQARGDTDQWSDLDLILFSYDRERYVDPDWLRTFGDIWLTYLGEADLNDPEWFVIYDGGLKLDIVLLQVQNNSPDLELLLQRYPYESVFARGVKVMFDQYGNSRSLPRRIIDFNAAPSAVAFDQVVSAFLVESITTAKLIARGDFWRAQHWFAHDLRPQLLQLIEWHSHGRDTWYNGRFINSWADRRVLAALPRTFPLYERQSLSRALQTMLDLLQLLGEETGARLNFNYPIETHRNITHLIDRILGSN